MGSWGSSSWQEDRLPWWPSVGCGQSDHLSDMLDVRASSRCKEVGRRTSELIISSSISHSSALHSETPAPCFWKHQQTVASNHLTGSSGHQIPASAFSAAPSAVALGRPGCATRAPLATVLPVLVAETQPNVTRMTHQMLYYLTS